MKGKVQKLVIKNGRWEERKWNDRFLEIRGSTIQYLFKHDGPGGKVIDNIEAHHIKRLSSVYMDLSDETDPQSPSPISSLSPYTWQQVCENTAQFRDELQNCFYIRAESGDQLVRDYVFRTSSLDEAKDWVETIKKMIVHFAPPPESFVSKTRRILRPIVDSVATQVFFGLIICLNFIAFIYETQVRIHCDDIISPSACPHRM